MQRLKEFMKTTVNQTLCSHGGTVRAALKASFLSHKPFFHHSVTSWIYTNLSQLREVKRRKRKIKKIFFLLPKVQVFLFFFYFNPVSLEEIFSSLKFDAVITNYKRVCDTRTIFNDERRRQRLHVGLAGTRESRILFGLPNATCKLDRLPSLAVLVFFATTRPMTKHSRQAFHPSPRYMKFSWQSLLPAFTQPGFLFLLRCTSLTLAQFRCI